MLVIHDILIDASSGDVQAVMLLINHDLNVFGERRLSASRLQSDRVSVHLVFVILTQDLPFPHLLSSAIITAVDPMKISLSRALVVKSMLCSCK